MLYVISSVSNSFGVWNAIDNLTFSPPDKTDTYLFTSSFLLNKKNHLKNLSFQHAFFQMTNQSKFLKLFLCHLNNLVWHISQTPVFFNLRIIKNIPNQCYFA
jgi:hypothetical protein